MAIDWMIRNCTVLRLSSLPKALVFRKSIAFWRLPIRLHCLLTEVSLAASISRKRTSTWNKREDHQLIGVLFDVPQTWNSLLKFLAVQLIGGLSFSQFPCCQFSSEWRAIWFQSSVDFVAAHAVNMPARSLAFVSPFLFKASFSFFKRRFR